MHGRLATNPVDGILYSWKYYPGNCFDEAFYQCGNCDFKVNIRLIPTGLWDAKMKLESHLRTHVPESVLAIIDKDGA